MRQGDSYAIQITDAGIDLPNVSSISFTVGPYTKAYPTTVTYDSTNKLFSFPISQAESSVLIGKQSCTARIKYTSGKVEGVVAGAFEVEPSPNKEVI